MSSVIYFCHVAEKCSGSQRVRAIKCCRRKKREKRETGFSWTRRTEAAGFTLRLVSGWSLAGQPRRLFRVVAS